MKCFYFGKINEKNPPIFLTTFEGVKINQNLIFDVKNQVLLKLITSGRFIKESVLLTRKVTKNVHFYVLTTFEGFKITQILIFNV